MTPKEQTAMQQALEALEELHYSSGTVVAARKYESATAALREALAEQAEQEPVAWMNTNGAVNKLRKLREAGWAMNAAPVQQAEQEPVAWRWPTHNGYAYAETHFDGEGGEPLYAAPVRTVDLTDDEIREIEMSVEPFAIDLARAVIAADREKNK